MEAIEIALRPFIEWIDNDRIYDQPVLANSFLSQFQREHGNDSLLLLIVLKNVLLYSTDELDSPTLISNGCNRYIEAILTPAENQGTKNIFNLLLANTTGMFNGISEKNKEAMRAYIRGPQLTMTKGGKKNKRKSKRKSIKCKDL